jgi:hypothetical protein
MFIISIKVTLVCPTQFQSLFSWAFLMAYSKAEFKSNDGEASSCFKPF